MQIIINISQLVYIQAVIGQFSRLYFRYCMQKFKAVFVAKMFHKLSPSVLNFLGSKSSKLLFTSEIVNYSLLTTEKQQFQID